jgi:hypothetical protein
LSLDIADGPVALPAEDTEPRDESPKRQTQRDLTRGTLFEQLSEGFYYTPDATAYPSPYFLELYEDYQANSRDPIDAVSLRYINAMTKADPVALVRTRGMDNSVYQENEGFTQATFVLSGRSGDSALDHVRFQKMRNFLQVYAAKMKKHKNALVRGKDVQLVLHFPFEAESYLCDITDFTYARSAASSTNSFEFKLTIITNGRAEKKWSLPAAANALQKLVSSYDNSHKRPTHPCLVYADNELRERPISDPQLQELIVGPLNTALKSPETGCTDVVLANKAVFAFIADADMYPYVTYQDRFSSLMYTMMFASDMSASAMTYSGSRLGRCTPPPRTLRAYEIWSLGIPIPTFRYNMVSTLVPGIPVPTEVHTCTQGRTTAHDVAEEVYGDRSQADVIMDYNRMLDPFTREDGSPLSPGDTLFIPRPNGNITREGDVFGTDLRVIDGDLVAVGTEDIEVVTGYACYAQNIVHRMTTVRGDNKVYPQYGLRPFVGQSESSDVPGDLRANVRSQLMSDHRTERILSLTLRENGDKAEVDVFLKPVGATPSRVAFTYNLAG